MYPILNLLLYITPLLMFLACPSTQYPIDISSILGIWATNCLILPTYAELMVRRECTREGDDVQHRRALPKKTPTLTHYILSAWRLHLLERLGYCVIRPGETKQVLVMINNIINLDYTYTKKKAQETPCNHVQTHTHRPDNHMYSFKVSLESGTPGERPIPTMPQTPHGVLQN